LAAWWSISWDFYRNYIDPGDGGQLAESCEGLDLAMVDGGALAGSGFGPGEMIECGIVRAGGGVRGSRMGMTGGAQ